MSEMDLKILIIFGKLIPNMTTIEKEKLLSFGEGITAVKEYEKEMRKKQN